MEKRRRHAPAQGSVCEGKEARGSLEGTEAARHVGGAWIGRSFLRVNKAGE